MISKTFSLILLTLLFCSFSINCSKDRSKLLDTIHVEFQPELVSYSLLDKFDKIFENAPDSEIDFDDDLMDDLENYLDDSLDESYEEEMPLDDLMDEESAIPSLLKNNKEFMEDESLDKSYKKFAYRLCVLTTISKETTIYASESINV